MGTCEEGHDDIAPHEKDTCQSRDLLWERGEVVARAVIDNQIVAWSRKKERFEGELNYAREQIALMEVEIERCNRTIQALRLVAGLVGE